jgi:hypothetical protein
MTQKKYQPKTKTAKANRRKFGITNSQAAYLGALKRDLGEKYDGNGKSKQWASEEIDRCLKRLGRTPRQIGIVNTAIDHELQSAMDRDERLQRRLEAR